MEYPGEFPYTRGVHANMYRGRLWTMRQFSGFGAPEETNERFKFLLKNGQTGLSTAFDMPTLMGYDADHPISDGEVGHCGVNISSLRDMEILFDGIDKALREPDTQIRLFGKPSISGRRRLGVTVARGQSIDEAKEKAIRASESVDIKY